MAETPKKELKDGEVAVDAKMLAQILENQAKIEKELEDQKAKSAGLEELVASNTLIEGSNKLREKKTFEPKFRTVRLRKYPIAGDFTNQGWVVGWTSRGAYQKVDRNGVSPQLVDYIDIIFLGHERDKSGKLQAESVPLLDLMNRGEQVHCKILDTKVHVHKEPTGEEIDVTVFDPQHGLMSTGDKIDGYVQFSDITYTVQIPDVAEPVVIDGMFVN